VRLARHFVSATLAAWDLDDLDEVACLLTGELASNAVLHAGTAFQVTVDLNPPELLVEVLDFAPSLPVPGESRNDFRSGRGLVMVEALASRWGVRVLDEVKTVWFSLPVGDPEPSLT
jgi:anti-sigma regulatory factor (Ser/Thr protein kinase)